MNIRISLQQYRAEEKKERKEEGKKMKIKYR
jgi:hypothetical protein